MFNFPELRINYMGDFGKYHSRRIDEIAEENDKQGSLVGWTFRTEAKEIDLVFDHAIITINYKLKVKSCRQLWRVDEN